MIPPKLEELSLDAIVDKFNLYMDIYKHGVTPFTDHLKCLQRLHSKTLISKLGLRLALREDYLPFLINQYLRDLDLSCYFGGVEPVIKRLQEVGETVQLLKVSRESWRDSSYDWTDSTFATLMSYVPNIENVNLAGTCCSTRTLATIGVKCVKVRTLNLTCCVRVGNKEMECLCGEDSDGQLTKNNMLEYIGIGGTRINACGAAFVLSHFTNLKYLGHSKINDVLYETHIHDLQQCHLINSPRYNLVSLRLVGVKCEYLSDVLKICTIVCPSVMYLYVDSIENPSDMEICSKFTNLEFVRFSNLSPRASMAMLGFLKVRGFKLKKLILSHMSLLAESLMYCPNVRKLMLERIKFMTRHVPVSITVLPTFYCLTDLHFNGIDLSQEPSYYIFKYIITNSLVLQVIHLQRVQLLNVAAVDIILQSKCVSTLQTFDASFSDITEEVILKVLTAIPSLRKIVLGKIPISGCAKMLFSNAINPELDISWWYVDSSAYDFY